MNDRVPALQNMSARPRTLVTRTIRTTVGGWVAFRWTDAPPVVDAGLVDRLETTWRNTGFTGAAIVHPLQAIEQSDAQPPLCTSQHLVLNVLLRTRGNLLIAAMPLLEDAAVVVDRAIATEDPRLVALVGDE